jgi:hypothetical protein
METNIEEVVKKFFNRTYAVGIKPENNTLANTALHKNGVHKKDGLNYVKGKSKKTYKELFHLLNNTHMFSNNVAFTTATLELFRSRNDSFLRLLVKFANGKISEKQLQYFILKSMFDVINLKMLGSNKEETARAKDFDFPMKDTGSFFKQLKAWRMD